MPISKVQRRMGEKRWQTLIDRAGAFSQRMGRRGVSGAVFVSEVLSDVDPADADEIMTLLHRRKVVVVWRNRGEVYVYGRTGEAQPRPKPEEKPKDIERLLSALVPHTVALSRAIKARAESAGEARIEAEEAVRVHAGRIIGLCHKHASRGLSLATMRADMWGMIAEPVMKVVVYHEPRLQQGNDEEAFEKVERVPRRLPNGLSIEERVYRLIQRGGKKGVIKQAFRDRIRPKITIDKLDGILSKLTVEGKIVSGNMRVRSVGRPGVRYFAAEHGLPYVQANGQAVFVD